MFTAVMRVARKKWNDKADSIGKMPTEIYPKLRKRAFELQYAVFHRWINES